MLVALSAKAVKRFISGLMINQGKLFSCPAVMNCANTQQLSVTHAHAH